MSSNVTLKVRFLLGLVAACCFAGAREGSGDPLPTGAPMLSAPSAPGAAFEPFTFTDPDGKALPPETLVTLPDGRKVPVGAVSRTLDSLESYFTERDSSLRTKGAAERPIAEVPTDETKIQERGAELKDRAVPVSSGRNTAERPTATVLREGEKRASQLKKTTLSSVYFLARESGPLNVSASTSDPEIQTKFHRQLPPIRLGNDRFGVAVTGFAEAMNTTQGPALNAKLDGRAKAIVDFPFLNADAAFRSIESGNFKAKVYLKALKWEVVNQDLTLTTNLVRSAVQKDGEDVEPYVKVDDLPLATFPFVVGVWPITLEVGARITSGVTWTVDMHATKVTGNVSPRAALAAYAKVYLLPKIDLALSSIEGVIDGEINLIDQVLQLSGEAYPGIDEKRGAFFVTSAGASGTLRTMSGKIDAILLVTFPNVRFTRSYPWVEFFTDTKDWSETLVRFKGVNLGSTVFFSGTRTYWFNGDNFSEIDDVVPTAIEEDEALKRVGIAENSLKLDMQKDFQGEDESYLRTNGDPVGPTLVRIDAKLAEIDSVIKAL